MKDDLFVDELTESRARTLCAAHEVGAGFWYRGVRFQRLSTGILDCAAQFPNRGGEVTREEVVASIEHAKLIYAALGEAVPELGWGRPDAQVVFSVIDDYREAAVGIAEERDGRLVIFGKPSR